jgi:hypothetical protein
MIPRGSLIRGPSEGRNPQEFSTAAMAASQMETSREGADAVCTRSVSMDIRSKHSYTKQNIRLVSSTVEYINE